MMMKRLYTLPIITGLRRTGNGKKLVTISPETTIKAEILARREFYALPVCEGHLLVGIITTTDLIKYLINQYT